VTAPPDADLRRVRRLLRWYPRSWRARYGDEFAELLRADLADRPRDRRRTADVISSGLLARCTAAGLTSHELPPAEQIRAGIVTVGCALAAFGALGVAMLAQLATGWQWASPDSTPAAAGTLAMAAAAGFLALIALVAAIPVAWRAVAAIRSREARQARLVWPAGLAVSCAAFLIVGARHFENWWPGTGGTGAEHGLVPGGLAAFGWASTLSASAYWAHPALWHTFPASELAWMTLSPVAWITLAASVAAIVRRVSLPAGLLRYLARVAAAATGSAGAFLAGAASWVLAHRPGQASLFRPGLVDAAELLVMAVALIIALRAAAALRRALAAVQ
jgi:hypothetical protein